MKLYNKFLIRIVFVGESLPLCDKLKQALEQRVSDLEITKEKKNHIVSLFLNVILEQVLL